MKKVTFLAFGMLAIQSAFGQVLSSLITLQWSDSLKEFEFADYKLRQVPFFEGASFNESLFGFWPVYFHSVHLNEEGKPILQITEENYAPLSFGGKIPFTTENLITNSPLYKVEKGYERMKPVADVSILPIRKNPLTGELEKLISFRYQIQVIPSKETESSYSRDADDYVPQSVLASGRWFKIAVSQDGIYKLDKSFLESLGINTSQIDPRNIRVYGNGGGMVSEANSAYRYDDLYENTIEVVGESDGSFDASDYVLFYGQGPHRWYYDTTNNRFFHRQHSYSNYTYYFINTDMGTGKRVQMQSSSGQTPNVTVTQFEDYAFHESEEENMIESGREWYGEAFEFETFHSVPFSFQNIVCNSQVGVKAAFMSRSIYASNSFTLEVDNQNIGSTSIGVVCADYTCPFGIDQAINAQFNTCDNSFDLEMNYIKGAADAEGYLNYIEVNLMRELKWPGSQTNFRSVASWGAGNISEFIISNSDNTLNVWDVTDPLNPTIQQTALNGTELSFVLSSDTIHEFSLFDSGEGKTPVVVGEVANQNLHGIFQSDFVIVTASTFVTQAEELAQLHRDQDNITVEVVLVDELYNEFASGATDICAIRDFMRMLYVRSEGDSTVMPKYLLLFGDGSFDNKGNIEDYRSLIPTFQSYSSLSTTGSFVSDDFYGMLDTNEGGNMLDTNYKLDVGIGRLPVNNTQQANDVLNKIKIYTSPRSFGNWRNVLTFVGDDEDSNIHMNDCDDIAQTTAANYPAYNIEKIYLDAYQQISIPGGSRYPDVNNAIQNRLYNGTLILNYVGHGGPSGLAHERIFTVSEIENLSNLCKLACFVTATCEFSKYDDPALESAGEKLLLNPLGGAIAMVTTVRLVYSSANYQMNKKFMEQVLLPINGVIPPIGETFRKGKNNTTGDTNNRKFTLLADPALHLDFPQYNIETSSINGIPVTIIPDTISALQKVTITGMLEDWNGNILNSFNGFVYPTVYDKSVVYQTQANDPSSYPDNFTAQKNIIYNGKASVVNGTFSFSFIVPKDIQYQFGFGKLSYYAENGTIDAHGFKNDVVIGGVADTFDMDADGPVIQLYMNDENFANGGITDEDPLVLVKLSDASGVNTVGTGIGHDITGLLDNNSQNTYVMNNSYTADLDSYQSGEVRYPLNNLDEGVHSFNVKAWDVFNNSSQEKIDFVVAGSAEIALGHVLNYPNPFTTRTEFMFEHNMPGQSLDVQIRIYSVSGKLVKSIQQSITPESGDELCSDATVSGGYRIRGIYWDGKDDYGDRIGKGVYVYQVNVNASNGLHADQFEKLVILN